MIVLALLLAVDLVGGWTTHGPGDGAFISEVAVAAGSGRRIFAVAFEAGESSIHRSEDGGSSWERVSDSPGPDFVSVLAADPHDPDRLFAATVHAGFTVLTTRLFRSDDGGTSWTLKQTFFEFSSSCRIVFDATNPGIVYVVFLGGVPSVHRSLDGSETFSAFPMPFPAGDLASAPDGTLVAVSGFDVFVSHDRAESWTPTSSAPFQCSARVVAVDPNDARRWVVGTGQTAFPCGEIVLTEDGGATWTRGGAAGGPVEDVVLDAAHPGVLYAAVVPADSSSEGRVRASSDWGTSWTDLGLPIVAGASSLALAEDGKRLHAAARGGVYERSFRHTTALPFR